MPGRHAVHPCSAVRDVAVENLPCSQSVHALNPPAPEYVPAGQGVQAEAFMAALTFENVPAGQGIQLGSSVGMLLSEYLPRGQSAHVDCPVLLLKEPGQHFVHWVLPSASA